VAVLAAKLYFALQEMA
jgi:hypothetical protein